MSVIMSVEQPKRIGHEARTDEERVNILIVDDRPEKLLALEAALVELNENVVGARSGKEALRCLLRQDFAVILLDVNMPGMDGFETAALIRQRGRSELTPIIFVSAINDNENHVSRGYSLGAVDYIGTPIVAEILRAKVSVFVDLFRKTAQVRRQGEERARLIRLEAAREEAEMARERSAFLAEAKATSSPPHSNTNTRWPRWPICSFQDLPITAWLTWSRRMALCGRWLLRIVTRRWSRSCGSWKCPIQLILASIMASRTSFERGIPKFARTWTTRS